MTFIICAFKNSERRVVLRQVDRSEFNDEAQVRRLSLSGFDFGAISRYDAIPAPLIEPL